MSSHRKLVKKTGKQVCRLATPINSCRHGSGAEVEKNVYLGLQRGNCFYLDFAREHDICSRHINQSDSLQYNDDDCNTVAMHLSPVDIILENLVS